MKTLAALSFIATIATLALLYYGPRATGLTVAVLAGAVLLVELGNAVRHTKEKR
jgi:hypothetical protein